MKYVHKFATRLSIALFSALLTYLILQSPSAPQHPPLSTFAVGMPVEKFPILPRFEVPRNYGFFIGDQIPLRLIIEIADDIVVNLEKLPQKGQKHGPFEIADMQISRQTTAGHGAIYQVSYSLQYFGPTPLTAAFEGVEILYASVTERHPPRQTSTYKRVVTQPVLINMARLSPLHHTASRKPKGAIHHQRMLTVWLGGIFTAFCLTAGGVLGVKAWRQRVQHASQSLPLAPEKQDLHLPLYAAPSPHDGVSDHATLLQRLRRTLQAHIQSVYGLPAASMSSAEIAEQLPNHPDAKAIMSLLEWCDTLSSQTPYQPYEDEQGLYWDADTRAEKLQQVETT